MKYNFLLSFLITFVILFSSGCQLIDKVDQSPLANDVKTTEVDIKLAKSHFEDNKFKVIVRSNPNYEVYTPSNVFLKDVTTGEELLFLSFDSDRVLYSQYVNGNLYVAKKKAFDPKNYDDPRPYELWKFNDNGEGIKIYTHADSKYFQFTVTKDENLIAVMSDIGNKTYIIENKEDYNAENVEEKAIKIIDPIESEYYGSADLVAWNDDNSALWMDFTFYELNTLFKITLDPLSIKEYTNFDLDYSFLIPSDYRLNPNLEKIIFSHCLRPQDPPSQEELDKTVGKLYLYDLNTREIIKIDEIKGWHCFDDAQWLNDETFVYNLPGKEVIEYNINQD